MDSTQLLKGTLDLAVLAVLSDREGYGYDIVTQLRTAGLEDVGEASVYGTLRRLADQGYLESYTLPSEAGPNRKYYRLTSNGENQLAMAAKTWRRFGEVMDLLLREVKA